MNQEKIGRFIAQKRKEKVMTQEVLPSKLGVSFKASLNEKEDAVFLITL